jgi:hypothetical protein
MNATTTPEQDIISEIDRAWSDRLGLEIQISANLWHSWEAQNNAYAYLETAVRTIDNGHKQLAELRAENALMEDHVISLAKRAMTTGEPIVVSVAYLVYGETALVPFVGDRENVVTAGSLTTWQRVINGKRFKFIAVAGMGASAWEWKDGASRERHIIRTNVPDAATHCSECEVPFVRHCNGGCTRMVCPICE